MSCARKRSALSADLELPRAGIVAELRSRRGMPSRVLLQPEGILTGYLPVKEPWVGNGWGMYAPPSPGRSSTCISSKAARKLDMSMAAFYSAKTKPLGMPGR